MRMNVGLPNFCIGFKRGRWGTVEGSERRGLKEWGKGPSGERVCGEGKSGKGGWEQIWVVEIRHEADCVHRWACLRGAEDVCGFREAGVSVELAGVGRGKMRQGEGGRSGRCMHRVCRGHGTQLKSIQETPSPQGTWRS